MALPFDSSRREVQFDFCDVANCGYRFHRPNASGQYDKYLCGTPDCGSWEDVWWTTDLLDYLTESAKIPSDRIDQIQRISFSKLSRKIRNSKYSCGTPRGWNPITLTIKNPQKEDMGIYGLGIEIPGATDWIVKIRIQVVTLEELTVATPLDLPQIDSIPSLFKTDFTYKEQLSIETGFGDKNEWFEWVR